eukprot:TRINITY_DN4578_c0_g1_i1.p1 TRINITY_DN4578_c0_g1~~TRINITY_DN4578_c0_g1_i1.p1  ORF type:complete len:146 (-),score=20.86 TRINITY_DN4578_c0_g1_i1:17-454(-)
MIGFPLACLLTSIGATCCYVLSDTFFRSFIQKWFKERIDKFSNKLHENREDLFWYLLSIRMFPMTPNWFINLSSPIVGIEIVPFFLSIGLGLIPYNYVCVQTGALIADYKNLNIMSFTTIAQLMCASVTVAGLVFLKNKLKKKSE